MQSLKPARVRDHLSLFNWIYKHKPLYRGHYDFVYHCDDFVSLANQPENKFEDAVKSCLDRWPGSRFQQFLRDEDEAPGIQDQHVYFFSTDKIARVGKIMAVCMAVTIVLIPVFLLFLTELSKKATSIMVLVFVLSFAALMSLLTGARVENVFAATCA
ncbi:hypothetical protein B0O99DRAFT_336721 [Bisporella sp. PMI_857]|nr:hypothetical protein B0O99DRAFT_336721 [Bisporella sp. PMI_857]